MAARNPQLSAYSENSLQKCVRASGVLSSGNAPAISFRDSTIFFLLLELKAFRISLPTLWHWHGDYFELKAMGTCGPMKNCSLSLKELKSGPCSHWVVTRDNFSWPIYRAGQASNCCTSVLLTNLQMTSLPSEAPSRLTSPLAQNAIYTSFLTLSLNSCMWCSHMHTCVIWSFSLVTRICLL